MARSRWPSASPTANSAKAKNAAARKEILRILVDMTSSFGSIGSASPHPGRNVPVLALNLGSLRGDQCDHRHNSSGCDETARPREDCELLGYIAEFVKPPSLVFLSLELS